MEYNRVYNKKGYVSLKMPTHPNARSDGYVYEHVVLVSAALKKPIPKGAVCHHVNTIKDDNRNDNLVLCNSVGYHSLLHQRKRAFEACGWAHWRRCDVCKEYGHEYTMYEREGKSSVHIICAKERANKRNKEKRNRANRQPQA